VTDKTKSNVYSLNDYRKQTETINRDELFSQADMIDLMLNEIGIEIEIISVRYDQLIVDAQILMDRKETLK
jgi:hypothetical protein|tara:strand:+ start:261 stop:473 length:213 start_codon:yes stop_codon:yes gene_type:complete